MANDLSSKELILQNYLKELLRQQFPDVDLSDSGPFMEMFGLPQIKLLAPLVEYADRISLMQSVENADFLTDEEMDQLANAKDVYRKPGDFSIGYVTMVFSDIPKSGVLIIPAGVEVISKQDYRYQSVQTTTFDEAKLVDYYDPETFRYRVPVAFKSLNVGQVYDVKEGDITTIGTEMPFLERVVNESPFTGGKDVETNKELAQRVKEKEAAPNLGNNRGYKRFINNFDGVRDVLVVGYGHPLMKRDIVGEFLQTDTFKPLVKDVHWGTKVDIYLRGQKLTEATEFAKVQIMPGTNKYGIPLNNKPVHDIVDVRMYSNLNEFDNPDIDQSQLYVTKYSIIKDENPETIGTLNETTWVVFNDDRLNETLNVSVRYRYNSLIGEINTSMYDDDERPPTADVLLKEANKKYVFGALVLKMKSPLGLREKDRSYIRQQTYDLIDEVSMGSEVQFSDISSYLTPGDNDLTIYELESVVDYIHLPYQFMVLENTNRYIFDCLSENQRKLIEKIRIENHYLGEIFDKYTGYITTYDFFDVIHALTYENGLVEALKEIDFLGYDWGRKVVMFKMARNIAAVGLIPKKLSPARSNTKENEYFELGELYVYEDKDYAVNDWQTSISLIKNLASLGTNEENDHWDMLELVVYCAALIFITTTNDDLQERRDSLYEYLLQVTSGTPIEYKLQGQ